MLLKLNRIKNLGVFADYSWNTALPAFGRYNVIYGENGAGKTTLSRLLDCLKAGSHSEYPNLEFKIESQSGEINHGQPASRKIRVFNADYVQENIGQLEGSLKPILVIGAENKAVAEALAADQLDEVSRISVIQAANKAIQGYENDRGKIFTEIAKTISEASSGSTTRTYRKNNAEQAFQKLSQPKSLTDEQLQIRRSTIRQEVMEKIDLSEVTLKYQGKGLSLPALGPFVTERTSELCAKSAVSDAIARLAQNPDIASWVEKGHQLHKAHGSKDCEFCGQVVPAERWKQLDAHFSTADQELKKKIESDIADLENLKSDFRRFVLPDRMALYSDFRAQFDEAKAAFEEVFKNALADIQGVQERLNSKLSSRSSAMTFDLHLNFSEFEKVWATLVAVVGAHNGKTASFDQAREQARQEIEIHYLTSVRESVAEFDQKIIAEQKIIQVEQDGSPEHGKLSLKDLKEAIAAKKAQLSNAHKAGQNLTSLLHTFLGRSEIVFESKDDGYQVYRSGKPAKRLSEGERTAIAFIYFIVQLSDQNFSLTDGIVVIDDPVSSLDASSVYQAFAFLKNAVKDAKQVFLLTHNFGFLRLLLNWLESVKKDDRRFYMVVSKADADGRTSTIERLDQALIDHPTEYHFLFKTLASFQGDGTIAGCYHIPNVTRKVLETFLDFHVPGKKSLYAKLNEVTFDENKKTAIYKFANDLSHFTGQGFEPGLVQESQKNAAYLLEMIEALAPNHYNGMRSAVGV